MLSDITGAAPLQSENFVSEFINDYRSFLVEGEINDKYDPVDFVMPESDVDMSRLKLLAPISLGLILTYKCSSNCLYCYANRESKEDRNEMDYEFAKDIVDQAINVGVEEIYLCGGDPFINTPQKSAKWIIKLIAHINRHNIQLILSTKEFLSLETCFSLARAGVKNMQISIDSHKEETADMLAGRKGFLQDALQSIENLRKAGIVPTTKSVVTKLNYRDIPGLVTTLINRGVKHITLTRYFRSIYRHDDDLFIDNEDILWLNQELDKLEIPGDVGIEYIKIKENKDSNKMNKFLNRKFCPAGRTSLIISPSGKAIPCEQLPTKPPYVVGDFASESLLDIWKSEKLKDLMHPERSHFRGSECYDCEHFYQCVHQKGWCVMETYKVFNTTYGVHPECPKVRNKVRLF
jgi:radical SAM protein with 4Fe4S-binding SPASM domain